MKVSVFSPAFNASKTISGLIKELDDVYVIFGRRGYEMSALLINDNSTDETRAILDCAQKDFKWLNIYHNEKNLGNAANILVGYHWGVNSGAQVVGCLDSDGEHSPYAMIRHLQIIEQGECDGVSGSIIFPEHDVLNHSDRNMMRFWGGVQSDMAGIDGRFYIQSPGYNLHKADRVEKALGLFDKYKEFYAANTAEPFPKWGMHGVMIHLIAVGAEAHIKAAYLECFGKSPNRTPDKLILQSNAANAHAAMLAKFLPKK